MSSKKDEKYQHARRYRLENYSILSFFTAEKRGEMENFLFARNNPYAVSIIL